MRMRLRRSLGPGFAAVAMALAVTTFTLEAPATYSILAFERASGTFGFASASCVGIETLRQVYASLPSKGAVVAQSYLALGSPGRSKAIEGLAAGLDAKQTLQTLLDPSFDFETNKRQYLVIDALGGVATFTGLESNPAALDLVRSDQDYVVATAGNFVSGGDVLQHALSGFFDAGGRDLSERLVRGLAAASQDGRGDARCTVEGRPADSAWLTVGATPGVDLQTDRRELGVEDPVVALQERLAEWRQSHACPPPPVQTAPQTAPPNDASCSVGGAAGRDASLGFLLLFGLAHRRRRKRATKLR